MDFKAERHFLNLLSFVLWGQSWAWVLWTHRGSNPVPALEELPVWGLYGVGVVRHTGKNSYIIRRLML